MIIKIGHRGAMGYEPENTLISFQKAINLKVDMIEFDVHLCKTGKVVVIHDDKVNRTTDGNGYVSEKSLKELRELNINKNQKIPTLQETLDLIDKKVKVNIELKGKNTAKPVFQIIKKYVNEKGWFYGDFFISSFDLGELTHFYKLIPEAKLGYIIKKPTNLTQLLQNIKLYSVNISVKHLTKDLVNELHKKGIKVFVWTVNDKKEIKRIKSLKVDGIISDYPDRI